MNKKSVEGTGSEKIQLSFQFIFYSNARLGIFFRLYDEELREHFGYIKLKVCFIASAILSFLVLTEEN